MSINRFQNPVGAEQCLERTGKDPPDKASIRLPTEQKSAGLEIHVPSLFPLEFNFITAYKILVKTQEVLELACFRFAEKAMPEVLKRRKWHCPESAELNLWATEFLKRLVWFEKRPSGAFSPSRPLKELFLSIAQIRHHAVHRIPVTAKELEEFMVNGETIVQLFEDHTATALMSRARSEVHRAAAEMENKKNMLEARLTKVLEDVADKRAKLNRIEEEAIADTKRQDKENQLFADAHLRENIWLDDGTIGEGLYTTQSPAANGVDNDTSTALDSDMASYEHSNIDDAMKVGPLPSAVAANCVSDGGGVAEEFEDALTEPLRPFDSDGDEVGVEK